MSKHDTEVIENTDQKQEKRYVSRTSVVMLNLRKLLGRVDICKAIYIRRDEGTSPIDRTGCIDCRSRFISRH